MDQEQTGFGKALEWLKVVNKRTEDSPYITRKAWDGTAAKPRVFLQEPDKKSKMTQPYLYMEKADMVNGKVLRFPVDLSCESLLADDWITGLQ